MTDRQNISESRGLHDEKEAISTQHDHDAWNGKYVCASDRTGRIY